MSSFQISGNIVDVCRQTIFPGTISVEKGFIKAIARESDRHYQEYILPGFVDAWVHLESSMLVPTEFARLATVHGTVAAVCEPHKIANVLGRLGVHRLSRRRVRRPGLVLSLAPPVAHLQLLAPPSTNVDRICLCFARRQVEKRKRGLPSNRQHRDSIGNLFL